MPTPHPSVHAVLFDFGKVLSQPPNPRAWSDMHTVTGMDEATLHNEYWRWRDDYDDGTLSGTAYWTRIAQETGRTFSSDTVSKLIELDVELWTTMNSPMVDWAADLQRSGIRTGILSNIGDAMAEGIRNKFDWISRFDSAVWSHEFRTRKPAARIYGIAAEGLRTAPEHILFIDDRDENIAAAIAFGMQGILYSTHEQFLLDMQDRGFASLLSTAEAR